MSQEIAGIVDDVIRRRRTEKVLANQSICERWNRDALQEVDRQVWQAIAVSGWTPFHYPSDQPDAIEPWRVHWLRQPMATELATRIEQSDGAEAGKVPALLRGCGSLVMVHEQLDATIADSVKRESVNREHSMAVSAFVQSLLIAVEARGLGSYWASGGVLAGAKVAQWLSIPSAQRLVAAVFIDYRLEPSASLERLSGKLRDRRGAVETWTHVIDRVSG